MSYSEFEQLLELQDGKCAICGIRAFDVDHCHKTGNIRGLLCTRCNAVVGWVEKVITLGELRRYLDCDVFEFYKDVIVESESSKSLRRK